MQKQLVSQTQLTLGERAHVEQIEDYLRDREDQLTKVTGLMDGILSVAKDIGVEVKVQGEKLEIADANMKGAEDNMKKGNQQLDQAKTKGARNNKWLAGGLIGAGAFVFVLIFIVIIRR